MNLPDGFADEYWQMRERFDWAADLGDALDTQQAKAAVADMRDFLTRWQDKIGEPEIKAGLEEFSTAVDDIQRALDQKFQEALQKAVEARKDWLVAEMIFKVALSHIQIMKHAPPALRPGLEQIYREKIGREFDPADEFRECEASVVAHEQHYRQAFVKLEVDWPERLSPAIRQRLSKPTPADLNAWLEELQQKAV